MGYQVTIIFDQQLRLSDMNHKLHFSLPTNLFTCHTANGACDSKVTNSVIVGHHRTNITLLQKTKPQRILNITSGIYGPFMPCDISYDYILNIIAQADMVIMDRFFLKHS